MPNNEQGSGQTDKNVDRMSQGQRGGYGNTSDEAGGSQQSKDVDQDRHGQSGAHGDGQQMGGQGGSDDET